MGRYNSYPEFTAPSQPFESVLHTGQVRIRPYKSGSVKHAHVVLKKVGEEAYEDPKGRKRTRGVYSFFAAKVINCKPGKEIFFAIEDYIEERVVTFEADLHHLDDTDNDVLTSAKSEETLVQHESQPPSLPPKMRKMWARKEVVAVKKEAPQCPIQQQRNSVGIQANPTSASVGVQASPYSEMDIKGHETPPSPSDAEDPPLLTSSVEPQMADVDLVDSFCDNLSALLNPQLVEGPRSSGSPPQLVASIENDVDTIIDLPPEADLHCMRERSLSPMELESISSSPQNSPRISVLPSYDIERKAGCEAPLEQLEACRKPQYESSPTSVEPLISVKEEPYEIPLPPSPKPKPALQSFRAPVFVPARNNPFQPHARTQDYAYLDTPTTPNSIAVLSEIPETEIQQPTSTSLIASTISASLNSNDSPSVPTIRQSDSEFSRGIIRPSPVFVPATQLSQQAAVHSSQTQSELVFGEEEGWVTGRGIVPHLAVPGGCEALDDIVRKRKRTDGVDEPMNQADSLGNISGLSSKKWRPIVKQEPQSPVLPPIPSAEPALNDEYHKPVDSRPRPLSVSIRGFAPTSASPSSSQLYTDQSPTPMKANHVDQYALGFDSSMFRADPSAPSSRRASQSYIDLSTPYRPYQKAAAPASTPVKRFNRTRRRGPGIHSSLPVIKTAQIRMDIGSRDTIGVRAIVFDPSGDRFAVVCKDSSVRIWDSASFQEIARLSHSGPVISVAWMVGSISIVSLTSNGVVSRWSLVGKNKWMWEKLADSGDTDPSCFAYCRQRFAIASPRRGVRIWECRNSFWLPIQREFPRKDVLSLKFIKEGDELICGCSDGNLLRFTVLDSQVQQVMNFKTKVFHVDTDPTNSHALVAQALGSAHLVDFASGTRRPSDRVLQDYSLRDAEQQYGVRGVHGFKPIFTDYGDAVVFGTIEGRVLIWDRRRGQIIYEMDHGSDVHIQAVASSENDNGDQHLVSCTKYGLLTWWRLPIRIF